MALRAPWLIRVFMVLALCSSALSAAAASFEESSVPAALKDWIPWVLDAVPERVCPVVDGEAICAWPGRLALKLTSTGGAFEQSVVADREVAFELPGDAKLWPEAVLLDGTPATVLPNDADKPRLLLKPGLHRITGELFWKQLPEGIPIPPSIAIVTLSVNGAAVPFPRRDEDGRLWLQSEAGSGQESETLDLEVMRKVNDGVPLTLTTHIVLRVSGKSREVILGAALPPLALPLSVSSELPARIDKDGALRIQVRAGTHSVDLEARFEGNPEILTAPPLSAPWPEMEIWVWQANEQQRQVSVSGPPGIDPARTNLPEGWRQLPAYQITPGAALRLTTTRRGEPDPAPDRLSLSRELWLDLDGKGYTVRDSLFGELSRSSRLDLPAPAALGHVAVGGVDQLITESPADKTSGVELRDGTLNMNAEWRTARAGKHKAVGWAADVQHLEATLHLPPGWQLLTATGVDELSGTWWDDWDLFNFFYVLIISLAIGKLTRWYFGLVSMLTFVLLHQQTDAPMVVWVALIVALGLLKVLPEGRLRFAAKLWWWGTIIWLVLVLVPFSVQQVRRGLFPQIEEEFAAGVGDIFGMAKSEVNALPMVNAAPASPAEVAQEAEADGQRRDEEGKMGGLSKKEQAENAPAQAQAVVDQVQQAQTSLADRKYDQSGKGDQPMRKAMSKKLSWRQSLQQDPKAVVQTGPGVPSWQWRSWKLSWSGPVTKDHEMKLYLLSPGVNLVLSFLRVLLAVGLALVLVRETWKAMKNPTVPAPQGEPIVVVTAGTTAALILAMVLGPTAARAEVPPADVLQELQNRLVRGPDCAPNCLAVARLDIALDKEQLKLTAEVHAGERGSMRLPGPAQNWVPREVTVDGKPIVALVVTDDGFIRVRLEPGRHIVVAEGPIPPGNTLTLELGEVPRYVTAVAPEFAVDGVQEDGRAESSIQLSRTAVATSGATAPTFEENAYPPWLEVTRALDLGLPWLVRTTVRRISPTGSPIVARVPLLPGESVTESELQVENGAVVVSLGRSDTEVSWSATLAEQPRLALTAPTAVPWSEVWSVSCSPMWQCRMSGLAPIQRKVGGRFAPLFRPWPGEQLAIALTRPRGAAGQSTTIDSAQLSVEPGERLATVTLKLVVRSSRGGEQEIALPGKALVQYVRVDGTDQPHRQQGSKLAVTLRTGGQSLEIQWQQEGGIAAFYTAPKVALGGMAVNATVSISLPPDRWLLLAGGPTWGPAILFWGYALTILLAAFILSRLPLSPLKTWQWLLLALGLTQVPVPVSLIIVGWFFVMAWRAGAALERVWLHNTLQILLGIWTVVTACCIVGSVYNGLAVQPDMQVEGGGSYASKLIWYADRVDGSLPTPWVLSVPLLVWKLIMLAWALWLAGSIVKWAPWAWKSFSAGTLWRKVPPKPRPPLATPNTAPHTPQNVPPAGTKTHPYGTPPGTPSTPPPA